MVCCFSSCGFLFSPYSDLPNPDCGPEWSEWLGFDQNEKKVDLYPGLVCVDQIAKKKRFSIPRDVKESLPSLGIETISKKKPFHP